MFRLLLYFVLLSPLLGIALKEFVGAYGLDTKSFGHYNGATLAYLLYLLFFFLAYRFASKLKLPKIRFKNSFKPDIKKLGRVILGYNLVSMLFLLFVVGGINVILGNLNKVEYRESWHSFGFIVLYIRNVSAPFLAAYLTFVFLNSSIVERRKNRNILIANFLVLIVIGLSYGFKSSIIFILLPSIILLTWNASLKKIIFISAIGFFLMVFLAIIFDGKSFSNSFGGSLTNIDANNPLFYLLYRMTVMQGDVSWKVWDMYVGNEDFFDYSKTLWSAIGNHNMQILLGLTKFDPNVYAKYNYTMMLTETVTPYSLRELISGGYNVIGTVFSEGVISAGRLGIVLFGTLAGFITGVTKKILSQSYYNNNALVFVIMAVVFTFNIYRWLNGGGIVNLIHIANVINIILALITLRIIVKFTRYL